MTIDYQKIIIIKQSKPITENINEELQWFGSSLGLFNIRDKDKSCFRIFIELLKTAKERQDTSSDKIALKLNLSRGTVVHHLNKLLDAGLIISKQNKYLLRVNKLETLTNEIERDIHKTLKDLKEIASNIDSRLKL